MKKILLAVAVLGLLLVLALVGVGAYLVSRINTAEFKASLLARAKEAAGTDVQVSDVDISLLSGVTMKGVRIANPQPFKGTFLSADAFVLRYRLGPLLAGRVEVEELSLEKPVVSLAMDAKGSLNYERLGGPAPAGKKPAQAPAGTSGGSGSAVPLKLVLQKLAVEDARVSMTDADNIVLFDVDDADFGSSFEVTSGGAVGKGKAGIKVLSMADMLFLRDVSASLDVGTKAVKLAPLSAKLAGGTANGDFMVDLEKFRYTTRLEVKGAKVATLISEAKAAGGVEGTLSASASFEGTGGMETIKGKGRADITDCRVSNVKVLLMLSALLRVPELADPELEECRIEFQMNGYRVSTPVLNLKGPAIRLTGKGTTNMQTSSLAYDLNLALANSLLDKIPAREMRAAFVDRGDGFGAVDFKVFGTTTNPQNDLASRIGKAAAGEAVKKFLGGKKLF